MSIGQESNGADSHTIVQCKLSADDLVTSANDMKDACRKKYGENVVVHVPISSAAIQKANFTCSPPEGASCSATPWVLGAK